MKTKKIELPLSRNRTIPVDAERVLCNDVVFKGESNPHDVRLWLVLSAYGPLGAAWASDVREALDVLVDADLAEAILVDEATLAEMSEEEREVLASLGDAGEACDLSHVAVEPVKFDPAQDWLLLCKFAEARGAGHDDLDF